MKNKFFVLGLLVMFFWVVAPTFAQEPSSPVTIVTTQHATPHELRTIPVVETVAITAFQVTAGAVAILLFGITIGLCIAPFVGIGRGTEYDTFKRTKSPVLKRTSAA